MEKTSGLQGPQGKDIKTNSLKLCLCGGHGISLRDRERVSRMSPCDFHHVLSACKHKWLVAKLKGRSALNNVGLKSKGRRTASEAHKYIGLLGVTLCTSWLWINYARSTSHQGLVGFLGLDTLSGFFVRHWTVWHWTVLTLNCFDFKLFGMD